MDKIKIMKKITYLVLILGSLSLSAQTYQQYKKQKDYEQRYIREQRQKQQNQFNQKVITAFKNYAANMKKYEALVLKYKSVDYVRQNYPKLCNSIDNDWIFLSSVNMSYQDTEYLNSIRHIWLSLDDSYQ
jgi:hypothetical protein